MTRRTVEAGTEWGPVVGYSRAVRVGERIEVAGTVAVDDTGATVAPNDPYAQTRHAIGIIERALADLDATLADVVRTRLFVTDIDDWEAVGRAHGEAFGDVRPASTMVEVSRLVAPDLVVEVEAVAVVEE